MAVRVVLRALVCISVICVFHVGNAALGQLYREDPGRREFTGDMLVRPLQVEHWRERGFNENQARELHRQTTMWLIEFLGDRILSHHERMDRYRFRLRPGETENEMGAFLLERGVFRYVCPDWRYFSQGSARVAECTSDPNLGNQWHHLVMESCAGWQIHTAGHDDVIVTLIDVGLRKTHEDLDNAYRQEAYNSEEQLWESENGTIWDASSHGTHVNGCAAATGNNGKGVSGVGWTLRHRMVRSGGVASEIVDAMWMLSELGEGDRIFSIQWVPDGSETTQQFWDDESQELVTDWDVLIFMSAGNRITNPDYRDYDYIIIVGGTELNGSVESVWYDNDDNSSKIGAMIDIMAPAKNVYSTRSSADNAYGTSSGTSYSSPLAAGLAALIWSYNPNLSGTQVRDLIFQGCSSFSGYDEADHGHGRINVFNSLALASGDLWTRDPYPGTAGQTNWFKAAGGTESATVTFYYGTSTGSTSVPGCSGLNVDIDSAQVLGTATAGDNGAAIYSTTVPSGWSNTTVYLQCVEIANCRKSNLIEFTFP